MCLAKLLSTPPSSAIRPKDRTSKAFLLHRSSSLFKIPLQHFSKVYKGLYFSVGAGGQGGEERTKKVDYEGALKIFDA